MGSSRLVISALSVLLFVPFTGHGQQEHGPSASDAAIAVADLGAAGSELDRVRATDGGAAVEADGAFEEVLWTIDAPDVTPPGYAIVGEVRTGSVEAAGHLFMLNDFAAGTFFSKTLAAQGPMRSLTGQEPWRSFAVPFYLKPEDGVPRSIRFGLSLPGGGEVELRGVRLTTLDHAGLGAPAATPAGSSASGWWSPRSGWIIGASLGSGIGIAGALIGVAGALGRMRAVLVGLAGLFSLGLAMAVTWGIALATGQPQWVLRPLSSLAIVLILVPVVVFPGIRSAWRQTELRRLAAMDSG